MRSVIASHRIWTFYNSDRRYRFGDDHMQSWVCPPSGTYCHYVRYKGRLMCLVGIGSTSWMQGVITENFVAEFKKDNEMTSKNRGQEEAASSTTDVKDCIQSDKPKRVVTVGANYYDPAGTSLGPDHLRDAFDILHAFVNDGTGSSKLSQAFTTFIIHLWDSARNDIVKELVLESFITQSRSKAPHLDACMISMMKNWEHLTLSALRTIEFLKPFMKHEKIGLDNPFQVLSALRILHRPGHKEAGIFHTKDLPVALENGGRKLQTAVDYPSWVVRSYPQYKGLVVAGEIVKIPNTNVKGSSLPPQTVGTASCTSFSQEEMDEEIGCSGLLEKNQSLLHLEPTPTFCNDSKVVVPVHPLIDHWISILCDPVMPSNTIESAMGELGRLLVYEATRDWLPTLTREIRSPLGMTTVQQINTTDPIMIVPILEGGIALAGPATLSLPSTRTFHLGIDWNESTQQSSVYMNKLPERLSKECHILILEPFLETGARVAVAVDLLNCCGVEIAQIRIICALAAPLAIGMLNEKFPGIYVCTGSIAETVNKIRFNDPGLGDDADVE